MDPPLYGSSMSTSIHQKVQLAMLNQQVAQETADRLQKQAEACSALESQLKQLAEIIPQDSDKVCC
jgi:hypothetical protein